MSEGRVLLRIRVDQRKPLLTGEVSFILLCSIRKSAELARKTNLLLRGEFKQTELCVIQA